MIPLRTGVLALLLAIPAALDAQEPTDSTPPLPAVEVRELGEDARRFRRMIIPAIVGSGAGLVAGTLIGAGPVYEATGWGAGGDDPGLETGLAGAVIGSTVGSMLGAYVTRNSEYPVSLSRAFLGATVGLGTGILVGIAGAELGDQDLRGLVIGFSVGQGLATTLFAIPYP